MAATYHPEGNRDFRRYIESTVPTAGVAGLNLLHISQMGRMGGIDRGLATALKKEAIALDPRLKFGKVSGLNIAGHKLPDVTGSRYMPNSHTVYAPKSNYGVLAHEIGHSQQYRSPLYKKTLAPLSKLGRVSALLGPLAPVLTANESEARRNSLIASGMQVPTLVEELDASRRGSKMLKKSGALKKVKNMTKMQKALMMMRPFAGIPSYLLAAMTPYLIYKYSKSRGLYEGKY